MTLTLFLIEVLLCFVNSVYTYTLIGSLPEHERSKTLFMGVSLMVFIHMSVHLAFDLINPFAQMGVAIGSKSMSVIEIGLLGICVWILVWSLFELLTAAPARELRFYDRFFVAPQPSAVLLQLIVVTLIFSLEAGVLWANNRGSISVVSFMGLLLALGAALILSRAIFRWAPTRSEPLKVIVALLLAGGSVTLVQALHRILIIDLLVVASGFLVINCWRNYRYTVAKANTPKF